MRRKPACFSDHLGGPTLPTGGRCQANMANMRQSIPDSCFFLSHVQCESLYDYSSCPLPARQLLLTLAPLDLCRSNNPRSVGNVLPTNDRAPFVCTRVPKEYSKMFLNSEVDSLYAGLLMPQRPAGFLLIAKGRWQNARQAGMETGLRCVPSPCFISSSFQSSVETLVTYKIGSITKQTDLYL